MGIRSKTFVTVLLVGVVVGAISLSVNNKSLFKGQIFSQKKETVETSTTSDNALLPDLNAKLEVILPENKDGDLNLDITIENIGEGSIEGGITFIYTILINDQEVFSNSDSYSQLDPLDSFNFKYPIAKTIYQYPNEGKVKFIIDKENTVKESNEENNIIEKEYKF